VSTTIHDKISVELLSWSVAEWFLLNTTPMGRRSRW